MKILVLCDQGNNRSVTLAHHLKYWGHDVLAAGLKTNTTNTIQMLYAWADRVILTERKQYEELPQFGGQQSKIQLWDIGPDIYKRPFNPELLAIVRRLMTDHAEEYKS